MFAMGRVSVEQLRRDFVFLSISATDELPEVCL